MAEFLRSVDARTKLAGRNKLEVLLFTLGLDSRTGREETFGINVFKVREVMRLPEITHAPDTPEAIEGMVSLRGSIVPVISLPKYCRIDTETSPKILIITEYNRHVQGFLVHAVDSIVRLDWEDVKVPPPIMIGDRAGLVTAVTELEDGRLVMVMDVEQVLADIASFYSDDTVYEEISQQPLETLQNLRVLFADDSVVARRQIRRTLESMRIAYVETTNGVEAWTRLQELAEAARAEGTPLSTQLSAVLTDIEMPEMDGYVLTQRIKEDARFQGIPVIMHSSLSGVANQVLGTGVGADDYVSKFDPRELAVALRRAVGATAGTRAA